MYVVLTKAAPSGTNYNVYPVGSTISHDATKIIVGNSEVSDINLTIKNLSFTLRGDEAGYGNLQFVSSRRYTSEILVKFMTDI